MTVLRNPLDSLRGIRSHGERAVRLAIELRVLELRGKAVRLGIGAGLGAVAVLIAPLVIVFLLAAAAAALATTMSVWLAILIVAGVLALLVGGLAASAVILVKRALRGGTGA